MTDMSPGHRVPGPWGLPVAAVWDESRRAEPKDSRSSAVVPRLRSLKSWPCDDPLYVVVDNGGLRHHGALSKHGKRRTVEHIRSAEPLTEDVGAGGEGF